MSLALINGRKAMCDELELCGCPKLVEYPEFTMYDLVGGLDANNVDIYAPSEGTVQVAAWLDPHAHLKLVSRCNGVSSTNEGVTTLNLDLSSYTRESHDDVLMCTCACVRSCIHLGNQWTSHITIDISEDDFDREIGGAFIWALIDAVST